MLWQRPNTPEVLLTGQRILESLLQQPNHLCDTGHLVRKPRLFTGHQPARVSGRVGSGRERTFSNLTGRVRSRRVALTRFNPRDVTRPVKIPEETSNTKNRADIFFHENKKHGSHYH